MIMRSNGGEASHRVKPSELLLFRSSAFELTWFGKHDRLACPVSRCDALVLIASEVLL